MILATQDPIPHRQFLDEVIVTQVDNGRVIDSSNNALLADAIHSCVDKRQPVVVTSLDTRSNIADGDGGVVFCHPIFKGPELRSIVSLAIWESGFDRTGVFETWSPTGKYHDLSLSHGYFGRLDRFQNVSSYVRFERGSGLPGQAWKLGRTVIHNDLSNHPEFLRAAGASAASLDTAIGIPCFADEYVATSVLISGTATPIARAFEVHIPLGDGRYELVDASYSSIPQSFKIPIGGQQSGRDAFLSQVEATSSAVVADAPTILGTAVDRSSSPITQGIGIPTFVCGSLSCITVLVL